jgi:hypothetical protein
MATRGQILTIHQGVQDDCNYSRRDFLLVNDDHMMPTIYPKALVATAST